MSYDEVIFLATIAAWAAVAGMVVWLAGPPVATLLGWTKITVSTTPPGEERPALPNWVEIDAIEKLKAKEFSYLGPLVVKIAFDGVHWWGGVTQYLFADDRTVVSTYRFQSFSAPSYGASSLFADGLVCQTGCSNPDIKVDEPHYLRAGVDTRDVVELLDVHRRAVHLLVHRGALLVPPESLEVCRKIVETEWETVYARSQLRDLAKAALVVQSVMFGLGGALAALQSTWLASALAVLGVLGVQQGLRLLAAAALMLRSRAAQAGATS